MKKHLIALAATLGMAATSAPAMAGGSYSVSGYISAPVTSYAYTAPYYGTTYSYTPYYGSTYGYPNYSYVSPSYYSYSYAIVGYGFSKSYYKLRHKNRHHLHGYRHH